MIGNSNYIGTCLNGLPTSTKNPSKMPYSVSSTKFFKDKNIKTSHWVGQSELKWLYLLDFLNRKQLIDKRDAELNEMPELKTVKIKFKKYKDKNDDHDDTIPMYVQQ